MCSVLLLHQLRTCWNRSRSGRNPFLPSLCSVTTCASKSGHPAIRSFVPATSPVKPAFAFEKHNPSPTTFGCAPADKMRFAHAGAPTKMGWAVQQPGRCMVAAPLRVARKAHSHQIESSTQPPARSGSTASPAPSSSIPEPRNDVSTPSPAPASTATPSPAPSVTYTASPSPSFREQQGKVQKSGSPIAFANEHQEEHYRLVELLARELQLQALVVEQGRRAVTVQRGGQRPPLASAPRTPLNANTQKLCKQLIQHLQLPAGGPLHPDAVDKNCRALVRMYQQVPAVTLQNSAQPMLDALVDALLAEGLLGFTVRQTTGVVHAVTRLPCKDGHAHMLLARAMEHLQELGDSAWLAKDVIPTTISTMLGAYAAIGYTGDCQPLVAGVTRAVESGSMCIADAHTWSNTLYACAKLQLPPSDMPYTWTLGVGAVTEGIMQGSSSSQRTPLLFKCPSITPQDISNTLWACAKAGYHNVNELPQAVNVAVGAGLLDRLKAADWALILWSAAKLRLPPDGMLPLWRKGVASVAQAVLLAVAPAPVLRPSSRIIPEEPIKPNVLATALWACAVMRYGPGVQILLGAAWQVVCMQFNKWLGTVRSFLVQKGLLPDSPQPDSGRSPSPALGLGSR